MIVPALALFLLFCWLSSLVIMFVGGLRTFREHPMSLNRDENIRRMTETVTKYWGGHLKALGLAQMAAGILLAIVVLL